MLKNIIIKNMQHCTRLQGAGEGIWIPPDLSPSIIRGKEGGKNTGLGGRHEESYIPSSNREKSIVFSIINRPGGAALHLF